MEKRMPTKNCAACLWFTDHNCNSCMFKRVLNRERIGLIDITTYQCARDDEKCPRGAKIDKGFVWEEEEVE